MSDVDEMVAWYAQVLDEDERVAQDAGGRNWGREAYGCVVDAADNGLIVYSEGTPSREQADHIARHDPDRALREVEADRHIIAEYERVDRMVGEERGASFVRNELLSVRRAYRVAIAHRAAARSDQPGYQESWRP